MPRPIPSILTPSLISRQREIAEVFLKNGWDYMRRLLTGNAEDEPELPPPAVLRNILTELGPVYVKLGQLLSTRPDLLSPAYIQALSDLQSTVPAVPVDQIQVFIRQNMLRSPEEVFAEIDYIAIAAGSIGQTHRAVLQSGQPVAVKVQRPGIIKQVERDMSLIKDIAKLVSTTQFGQRYNIIELADEFKAALTAELDFTTEARYTDELRQNLLDSAWVDSERLTVPRILWPLTNSKILVMEWLDGKPLLQADIFARRAAKNHPTHNHSASNQFVDRTDNPLESISRLPQSTFPSFFESPFSNASTDSLNAKEKERSEITTLLFRAFLSQYFVTGFFHADPHPGNLFYLDDGTIAILDCGMMGRLDPKTRATLTELVLAIVSSDAQRCAQLTLQVTEPLKPVDLVRLESDYARLLGRYYGLDLSRFNTAEAFGAIIETGIRNHLRWPANIGLFTKSLANLEGVARQFDPSVNLMSEIQPLMIDLFQQQLIGTDPLQLFLRTGLELRNLSMSAPRQVGFLLDRLSDETLRWNLQIQGLSSMQRSLEKAANRRAFSTVVAALIIGAAIVSTNQQTEQLQWLSVSLFASASFLGLWLIGSILRSGRWQ
ncbi:ABC1 family protein [Synechococcus sp. PCC 7335]|uniref:ABC1 kinase family protein n=1 Tax=Synechococcus sp. (strain ATCC 29403 / PCC 7335) TaxID=91464 RepID=UPI00017EB828|nr:AarF/UbiB family protein [Synechococcus sp. PCC 7335]EDX87021.1 ABC1 family protein [Synechococcus sp. PCC 7335]